MLLLAPWAALLASSTSSFRLRPPPDQIRRGGQSLSFLPIDDSSVSRSTNKSFRLSCASRFIEEETYEETEEENGCFNDSSERTAAAMPPRSLSHTPENDDSHDNIHIGRMKASTMSRRRALLSSVVGPPSLSLSLSSWTSLHAPAQALASPSLSQQDYSTYKNTNNSGTPDLSCLADLPPLPPQYVRIYACRHGQTENNRLRLVQGARSNPPLNNAGIQQAQRLGQALSQASVPPTTIYHSPLLRAQQTAAEAAKQLSLTPSRAGTPLPTQRLASVGEVDFGPTADGTSVKTAQRAMVATYARWAVGDLDVKMTNDGESGRQVLRRVQCALEDLVRVAQESESGAIAVVSHSTFLRTLLVTVQNRSLVQVAQVKVKNASISVLDIAKDDTTPRVKLGPYARLLGGWLSRADGSFSLQYPPTNVLRVNETRHLGNLG